MSSPKEHSPREAGLQAERTALAWSRTSLGVLGNGALLVLRDLGPDAGPPRVFAAGTAVVIAVVTYVVARRRQHLLNQRPLPAPLTPRRTVRLIGVSVLVLIVVTAFALPL